MARPVTLLKALAAASATNICLAQTGAAGVPLVINGATAVTQFANGLYPPLGAAVDKTIAQLDTQRRVLITSAGNDSGITFTVYGYDDGGAKKVSTITGGNSGGTAAVATPIDYAQVVAIVPSGPTASTVTVGTNTTGSTSWVAFNPHVTPPDLGLSMTFPTGTATASAEYCIDRFLPNLPPFSGSDALLYSGSTTNPNPYAVTALSGVTGTPTSAALINTPIAGWRLTITSGTGSVQLTGIQSGLTQQ